VGRLWAALQKEAVAGRQHGGDARKGERTAVKKVAPCTEASRQKVPAAKRPSAGRMTADPAASGASIPAQQRRIKCERSTETWVRAASRGTMSARGRGTLHNAVQQGREPK